MLNQIGTNNYLFNSFAQHTFILEEYLSSILYQFYQFIQ
jgi:hypothetical protein